MMARFGSRSSRAGSSRSIVPSAPDAGRTVIAALVSFSGGTTFKSAARGATRLLHAAIRTTAIQTITSTTVLFLIEVLWIDDEFATPRHSVKAKAEPQSFSSVSE